MNKKTSSFHGVFLLVLRSLRSKCKRYIQSAQNITGNYVHFVD